jgi:hypothetical protein
MLLRDVEATMASNAGPHGAARTKVIYIMVIGKC